MKKKSLILILVLALSASCLFFGCSAVTRESVAKEHKNDIKVSFDIGSGAMWNGLPSKELYCYYPKSESGTYLADPSKPPFGIELAKANYFLEGWYKDPDYNEKWDFGKDKASENITLYAHWLEMFRFIFLYKEDGEWKPADYVLYVGQNGLFRDTHKSRVKREGYTLFGVYSDEECTAAWDHDNHRHKGYMNGSEQVDPIEYVYTTWIEGDFTFMQTVKDAAYIASGNNMYLLKDIDFAGADWDNYKVSYGGIIEGNDHTIRNITLKFPEDLFGYKNAYVGLFGRLTKDAVLRNITFENIVIEVDDDDSTKRVLGLLAGMIENGATFENVKITGKIVVKRVKPTVYTLGLVAGENEGDGLTGLDYSGVVLVDEFVGYDVKVDSDGNTITVTAA